VEPVSDTLRPNHLLGSLIAAGAVVGSAANSHEIFTGDLKLTGVARRLGWSIGPGPGIGNSYGAGMTVTTR
jgi:hypothetical protein